jgi:hypothetical protein
MMVGSLCRDRRGFSPLCGLIWRQGETNSGTQPPAYAEMVRSLGTSGDPNSNVNQGLAIVDSTDKNFAIASSAGIALEDHIDYNAASQRVVGQRYTAKLMEVFNKQ